MDQSEYQELVEFIAPSFDEIRERLAGVEGRLGGVEGRLTKLEVSFEQSRSDFRMLAESLGDLRRKVEARFDEPGGPSWA